MLSSPSPPATVALISLLIPICLRFQPNLSTCKIDLKFRSVVSKYRPNEASAHQWPCGCLHPKHRDRLDSGELPTLSSPLFVLRLESFTIDRFLLPGISRTSLGGPYTFVSFLHTSLTIRGRGCIVSARVLVDPHPLSLLSLHRIGVAITTCKTKDTTAIPSWRPTS